jgi:hypothetical protein
MEAILLRADESWSLGDEPFLDSSYSKLSHFIIFVVIQTVPRIICFSRFFSFLAFTLNSLGLDSKYFERGRWLVFEFEVEVEVEVGWRLGWRWKWKVLGGGKRGVGVGG